MSTIETALLSLLVVDALALTVLVLLQQGKGADVGAAFGSGSSNTMFGSGGSASFMTKITAWLAIGFFAIAFSLAYIAKQRATETGTLGIPTALEVPVDDLPAASESADVPQSDLPSLEALDTAPDDAADDVPNIIPDDESRQ